ncbi:hypothetical protein [Cetobacterium sp.]|uniref:hypothetical protein n=1 Tax=Cetobacterium sp. TaxID=2071632 RepID=UPI003F2EFCD3
MKYTQLLTRLAIAMPMFSSVETKTDSAPEVNSVDTSSFKKFEKILPDIKFNFKNFSYFYNLYFDSDSLGKNELIKNYLEDVENIANAMNNLYFFDYIDIDKKKRLFSTFCYDFHRISTDKVDSKDLKNYNGLSLYYKDINNIEEICSINSYPTLDLKDSLEFLYYILKLANHYKYLNEDFPYGELSFKLIRYLKDLKNEKIADKITELDNQLQDLSKYYSELSAKHQNECHNTSRLLPNPTKNLIKILDEKKNNSDVVFAEILNLLDIKENNFEIDNIINTYLIIRSCHDFLSAIKEYKEDKNNFNLNFKLLYQTTNLSVNIFMGLVRSSENLTIYKEMSELINTEKVKNFTNNNPLHNYFEIDFYFQMNEDTMQDNILSLITYIEKRLKNPSQSELELYKNISETIEKEIFEKRLFKEYESDSQLKEKVKLALRKFAEIKKTCDKLMKSILELPNKPEADKTTDDATVTGSKTPSSDSANNKAPCSDSANAKISGSDSTGANPSEKQTELTAGCTPGASATGFNFKDHYKLIAILIFILVVGLLGAIFFYFKFYNYKKIDEDLNIEDTENQKYIR